ASFRDLAETLVHEWGHQLLYLINEAAPLVVSGESTGKTFRLPWSGQERDLYGYFHAFYIYILLVKYFDRAHGRDAEEQQRIDNRCAFILAGLAKAAIELRDETEFTPAGRALLISLIGEVSNLSRRNGAPSSVTGRAPGMTALAS